MIQLIKDGKIDTIELIVGPAESDSVALRYNHFHANYPTLERDGPIELALASADDGEVVFSNLERPPRHAMEMGFRLISAHTLHSWVTREGKTGQTIAWISITKWCVRPISDLGLDAPQNGRSSSAG